jgi:hypothetical protein
MKPPTAAQLRYLRGLAETTGMTFSPPRTSADASREIARLKALPADGPGDRRRERRQVQADLAQRPDDAVRVRPGETSGYGASAHWANARPEDRR